VVFFLAAVYHYLANTEHQLLSSQLRTSSLPPSTAPRRVLTAGPARAAACLPASLSLCPLRACRLGFGMRWDTSISLSHGALGFPSAANEEKT
jgi:hypothetical protein